MKLLLYCTKGKPYLYKDRGIEYALSNKKLVDSAFTRFNSVNGKIVAECDFEVEEIYPFYRDFMCEDIFYEIPNKLDFDDLLKKSCLDNQQLDDYLYANKGYAIRIKNLHIFDEPKKLNFYMNKDCTKFINKAPQNMQVVINGMYNNNDKYILISIQPQWLCKILNGEKTIEIRKKVLKGMLENE